MDISIQIELARIAEGLGWMVLIILPTLGLWYLRSTYRLERKNDRD